LQPKKTDKVVIRHGGGEIKTKHARNYNGDFTAAKNKREKEVSLSF
jgi:hypothetical protein